MKKRRADNGAPFFNDMGQGGLQSAIAGRGGLKPALPELTSVFADAFFIASAVLWADDMAWNKLFPP